MCGVQSDFLSPFPHSGDVIGIRYYIYIYIYIYIFVNYSFFNCYIALPFFFFNGNASERQMQKTGVSHDVLLMIVVTVQHMDDVFILHYRL